MDDDGTQRRLREVEEQSGEEQDGDDREDRSDDTGHLCPLACIVTSGCLRQRSVDDEALRNPCTEVSDSEADEFLVRIEVIFYILELIQMESYPILSEYRHRPIQIHQ